MSINCFNSFPITCKHFVRTKNSFQLKHLFLKIQIQIHHKQDPKLAKNLTLTQATKYAFFFDGSYIIYFNIKNQHFSLMVQTSDSIFHSRRMLNTGLKKLKIILVIVSYHCEPFEIFHSKVKYTTTKSHAFLQKWNSDYIFICT